MSSRAHRRVARGLGAVALAGALLAAGGGAAWAQGEAPTPAALEEARVHFERGVALFRAQDFNAALVEFQRAYELFNISATYQAMHRYPEALDALRQFRASPSATNPRQRAEADRAFAELSALVARLRLQVTPAEATVVVDGRAQEGAQSELV